MIEFEHVRKRFENGHEALKNVSFSVGRGEMAFLTGHSGAGKSTMLKLIALMDRPTSGKITVDKINLSQLGPGDIPYYRRRIGMIFQSPRLLYDRPVFDNVALPLLVSGYHINDIKRRVRAALDQVGLLAKENSAPETLSGGEQQRVGIARAVVGKPAVILADEPTGNLDPGLSREILTLFERFNHVGVTTLIATHDLALIEGLPYKRMAITDGTLFGA